MKLFFTKHTSKYIKYTTYTCLNCCRATGMAVTLMATRLGAIMGNVMFGYLVEASCAVPLTAVAVLLVSGGLMGLLLPNTSKQILVWQCDNSPRRVMKRTKISFQAERAFEKQEMLPTPSVPCDFCEDQFYYFYILLHVRIFNLYHEYRYSFMQIIYFRWPNDQSVKMWHTIRNHNQQYVVEAFSIARTSKS